MKLQWQQFAEAYARKPDKIKAYREAYPSVKTDESARVNATKLLKEPTIQAVIATKRSELTTIADAIVVNELKEDRKRVFLSVADKREILYNIAQGKEKIPVLDKNGNRIGWKRPDFTERVKAIELDNEMTGDFVPRAPLIQNNVQNNTNSGNTTISRTVVFKTRKTTTNQTFKDEAE